MLYFPQQCSFFTLFVRVVEDDVNQEGQRFVVVWTAVMNVKKQQAKIQYCIGSAAVFVFLCVLCVRIVMVNIRMRWCLTMKRVIVLPLLSILCTNLLMMSTVVHFIVTFSCFLYLLDPISYFPILVHHTRHISHSILLYHLDQSSPFSIIAFIFFHD